MTIEQRLTSKLEPHAKRIQDGDGNDFDYLPAVLWQLMEMQKRQAQLLDDTAKLLDSLKSTADAARAQITAFESAAQGRMEKMEAANNDRQTQLENSHSSTSEKVSALISAHAAHAIHTTDGLRTIGSQIKSFANDTQQSHVKLMRLLFAMLIASIVVIGLATVILQRH